MKLQAVTVSVNYSDFLIHTLEENHKLFDKWVIVTDLKDQDTFELCRNYPNVVCIQTDIFYTNGARFNKFAGINLGLEQIDADAWVLFLDSDIVLHEKLTWVLENINLDPTCIYGVDRVNCQGFEAWDKYKQTRDLVVDNWLLTDAFFKFGARLVHYYGYENGDGKFAGWNPLGFFQLAHRSSFVSYPAFATGADHCDLTFARLFPREKRVHIPEVLVIHLESLEAHKSVNWYGRVSRPFVPQKREEEKKEVEAPIIEEPNEQPASIREYGPKPPKNEGPFHPVKKTVRTAVAVLASILRIVKKK